MYNMQANPREISKQLLLLHAAMIVKCDNVHDQR